jgi:hypothetical protein
MLIICVQVGQHKIFRDILSSSVPNFITVHFVFAEKNNAFEFDKQHCEDRAYKLFLRGT